MNDYKPNSNRFKEEQKEQAQEKRAEKVVTGKVIAKKKSGLSKIADEFISEDAKNIKSYVVGEVLIPSAKKIISEVVTNVVDMILYGGSRGGTRRSTADRVSYTSYSSRDNRNYRDTRSYGGGYSYDDITLATRAEAEDVLLRMDEIMEQYGLVRVLDFYDLVGVTGNYTDNKYGWLNIRSAEIVRVRDGYKIKLPRAVPID